MKKFGKFYIFLILFLLYLPIPVIVLMSFNNTKNTATFTGFSLRWWNDLFHDAEAFTALKNTLLIAVCATVIATVIGTAAAIGIAALRKKFVKNVINSTTNIPMMNPEIVTGISFMLLFVFIGGLWEKIVGASVADKLGFTTLLIAHVTFCLPYVLLSVAPKLRQMDKHLPEAAQDLGCTPMGAFFKVTVPQIIPGIVTGAIMAFTLSLDDFVISYFASGSSFQTLPILIYGYTKQKVSPEIYALSTLVFVAVFILLILSNVASGSEERKIAKEKKAERDRKIVHTRSMKSEQKKRLMQK